MLDVPDEVRERARQGSPPFGEADAEAVGDAGAIEHRAGRTPCRRGTGARRDRHDFLRDVLVAEIPAVLRGDLYAVAALAGAVVVVIGHALELSPTAVAIAGAAVCFGLRFMAIRRGWQLPVARPRGRSIAETDLDE